ncbi:DUF488 family protein [Streptomyces sp. ICN441]|uniref:DUF488 domain-containing protein n=1 Tax=Streptomyces tirandamycinicus TaxID=2174846 RepID=A0A2S1SZ00_9ACTN|nr:MULTISPECIES: DUF488 family protein [Streptomyces]AWI31650.1 DUF488 domain-containing protein [Streptomyces tirandamycinicus]TFE58193.1 DUF488 family protein [Streptomyces sp. ICN441]
MATIRVRRVFDDPGPADGVRVLVDRLWPRGVSKERAAVDAWLKDVAPSGELRGWYHQDRSRYEEFDARYRRELAAGPAAQALERLRGLVRGGPVTLVTSVKSVEGSHVPTLVALLEESAPPPEGR